MELQPIVSTVLILQFLAFGWRVNREVTVGEPSSRKYVPAPDVLNVISMFAVLGFCILLPLKSETMDSIASPVLGVAAVLIVFHPVNVAAHYGLFSLRRREADDARYMTGHEVITTLCTIGVALAVGYWLI